MALLSTHHTFNMKAKLSGLWHATSLVALADNDSYHPGTRPSGALRPKRSIRFVAILMTSNPSLALLLA